VNAEYPPAHPGGGRTGSGPPLHSPCGPGRGFPPAIATRVQYLE